jgi:hypothetical protein
MIRIFVSLFFLFATATSFAQSFEGTISVSHSLRPQQEIVYHISDQRACTISHFNGQNTGTRVISDVQAGKYAIVIERNGQKQESLFSLQQGGRAFTPVSTVSNVQLTGQSKTIQGYVCQEVTAARDGQSITAWVAADLDYIDPAVFLTPQTPHRYSDFKLTGVKGLILEMQGVATTGKAYAMTHTITVEKVDANLLEMP